MVTATLILMLQRYRLYFNHANKYKYFFTQKSNFFVQRLNVSELYMKKKYPEREPEVFELVP